MRAVTAHKPLGRDSHHGDRLKTETTRVGVVLASVREGRNGRAFADWLMEALGARSDVSAELLDLRDWPLPTYDLAMSVGAAEAMHAEGSLPARWRDTVHALDAFVVVTPEYNHGYPGCLKNALDAIYTPWNHKPMAFVSYGFAAGGARAVEQLRQVAIELRMIPLRDELNFRLGSYATDARGFPSDAADGARRDAMLDELVWWASTCAVRRALQAEGSSTVPAHQRHGS